VPGVHLVGKGGNHVLGAVAATHTHNPEIDQRRAWKEKIGTAPIRLPNVRVPLTSVTKMLLAVLVTIATYAERKT
jgi:hypothetical protein